jgi:hypothetical protein
MAKKSPPPANSLSAMDLERNTSAIMILREELKSATDTFYSSEHGGRDGVLEALAALCKFLDACPQLSGVGVPIPYLLLNLMSLDHGVMTEMLRLPTKGGRAEAPMTHHIIKGAAVYTVRRLRATGMKAGDANAAVCRILVEEQIEPARKGAYGMGVMRPSTIANWVNKSADGSREWAPVVAFHLNEFLSKESCCRFGPDRRPKRHRRGRVPETSRSASRLAECLPRWPESACRGTAVLTLTPVS